MTLSTDRIEQIKALVEELRAHAAQDHHIAGLLDFHTVNERGEKCPMPTTPLEERLPSRAADALESFLTAHAPVAAIPEGYVLVPREATAENGMKSRLSGEIQLDPERDLVGLNGRTLTWTAIKRLYRAMLSAAPQPPSPLESAEPDPELVVRRRWPERGDRMKFLGENGYPYELEHARKVFEVGAVYEVTGCEVGDWRHTVSFQGIKGDWNGVMFALLPPHQPEK